MTQTYLNGKYTASLINECPVQNPFGFTAYYNIVITNTHTNQYAFIQGYRSSPLHTTLAERTDNALSMILSFSTEWKDDHRNDHNPDDDTNTFEDIYNELSPIMPDADMDSLNLYFYDLENPED